MILLNKEAGITSFDALRDIKRALGTGKVGHTGTLDKFARGLLLVLTGSALKLSKWFTRCDKRYIGKIHFGVETDTLDPEGLSIARAPLPLKEDVESAISRFTGTIQQTPPAFSAIHVNGKRASDMARSGVTPELRKRPVTVYGLELRSWEPPFADIFVHCSCGTYIRSLARDIALAAGSRAHLRELTRTSIAAFELESGEWRAWDNSGDGGVLPLPINRKVISALGAPWFEVSEEETRHFFHGKPLDMALDGKPLHNSGSFAASSFAAVFLGDRLIAIVDRVNGEWKYGCVFA